MPADGAAAVQSLFGSVLQLRPYQQEAIRAWQEAGRRGVLEMGTGTGKTLTALAAIHVSWPKHQMVLVACPTRILVDQWLGEIRRAFPSAPAFAVRSQTKWEQAVPLGDVPVFIVGTLHAMCRLRFTEWSKRHVKPEESLLIIDEAHRAGAPTFSKVLNVPCQDRLGLSATPHRTWDEAGNGRLVAGLGQTVFQYGLGEAIAAGHLSPYRYHIHPLPMSERERDDYVGESIKLVMTLGTHGFDPKRHQLPAFLAQLEARDPEAALDVKRIMIRRAKHHKEACGKPTVVADVVRGNDLEKCLVYCNTKDHVELIRQVLKREGLESVRYTSSEDPGQRQAALDVFRDGVVPFLVAIKCLDEGVDLPDTRNAIIVSSSATTREFIQRRGRLLRKAPGKALADIHDLLVLPVDPESFHGKLTDADLGLIGKELRRASLFAEHAVNRDEARATIATLAGKLGIPPALALDVEFTGLVGDEVEEEPVEE